MTVAGFRGSSAGCVRAVMLLAATGVLAQQFPEQVHLALTGRTNEMLVSWATQTDAATSSIVQYGTNPGQLSMAVAGSSLVFDDVGSMPVPLRLHSATLTALAPGTRYYYALGGNDTVYSFVNAPVRDGGKVYAVFADMGVDNAVALPAILDAHAQGQFDAVIFAGDLAYDMEDDGGGVGNAFFNSIQPIASEVPWNVCPGNHEADVGNTYAQYTNRFAGLAATAGAYSGSDTSLYYSLDDGLVHFVFVDTELWATGSSDDLAALLSWLEDDLKAVDRRVTPWVVAVGHRAAWMKHGGGSDLAPLLHDYGVNLLLAGHEHNYQRTYGALDTTPHPGCNVDANTYLNCNHTITIISGAPGCSQGISNETAPDDMLITSSLTYGFGLLTVVNETHLYWSWSSTPDATAGSNSSKGGDAAAADYSDFAWVVQMFAP